MRSVFYLFKLFTIIIIKEVAKRSQRFRPRLANYEFARIIIRSPEYETTKKVQYVV